MTRKNPTRNVDYEVRDQNGTLWASVMDLKAAQKSVRELRGMRRPFTIWRVTSERVWTSKP